jgi:hypothetical protein
VLQKDRRLVAVVVPDLGEVLKREDGDVEKAVREAVEESALLPALLRPTRTGPN